MKNNLTGGVWSLGAANFGTKFVSVLIAIILWGIVLGSRNVEVTKEIPLEVITSPEVAPATDLPDKVAFRLSGPKAFLRSIVDRPEEPIRVNLVGTKPAIVTYRFFSDNIRVPIGVKVLSIYPTSISIKLEHVRSRELPVHLQIQGTPPDGYRVAKVEVKPNVVHVTGPESKLNHMTELFSKPIDVSGLKTSVNEELSLDLADSFIRIDGEWPKVQIQIEPASANFRLKNIDIRVHSSFKSKVQEGSVTALVRATTQEMQSIDRTQVFATADLQDKPKGKHKVSVKVNLPQGISLVKVIPEQVHVTLY